MRIRESGLVLIGIIMLGGAAADGQYLVEHLEQYQFPDLPEGIALDQEGNIYTSMILLGEIRKRARTGVRIRWQSYRQGQAAWQSMKTVVYLLPFTAALSFQLFQMQTAFGEFSRTVRHNDLRRYQMKHFLMVLSLEPAMTCLLAIRYFGKVYRVSPDGAVADWSVDPSLLGDPNTPFPIPVGANGLAFSGDNLFVNNLTVQSIVRIPVEADGSAGTPTVAFSNPLLFGADGLAADANGNLYVANIVQNTILPHATDGAIDVLADVNDGLDGPSSLTLGVDQDIFFVNSGLVTSSAGGDPMPSLMRILIPEPSTCRLTTCGLLGLFGFARRMKHTGNEELDPSVAKTSGGFELKFSEDMQQAFFECFATAESKCELTAWACEASSALNDRLAKRVNLLENPQCSAVACGSAFSRLSHHLQLSH